MRKDKKIAIQLRKDGLSYNAISEKLSVPKSTLSEWFSEFSWSAVIKKDLTQKAFEKSYPKLMEMSMVWKTKWEKVRENARNEAEKEFTNLAKDPLFIAGVMIYWGEGDRNLKTPVRVSNTDPEMLRIFVKFLRQICNIPVGKIKGYIVIYPDLDETTCKKYWSAKIGIEPHLFFKTQVIQGRHKTKRLTYGIGAVRVSSCQLKEKMLIWIEKFSKHL